jgi:hypothetical protein
MARLSIRRDPIARSFQPPMAPPHAGIPGCTNPFGYPLAVVIRTGYSPGVKGAIDMMKWLTAIFVLLLLALGALPTAIDALGGWIEHRSGDVESIKYIARDINDLSASRRHKHDFDSSRPRLDSR